MPEQKITVVLERRDDGGLRVYSDDVPGLILSGADPAKVAADIWPALVGMGALIGALDAAERKAK